jgi:sulfur transfer protein SufE
MQCWLFFASLCLAMYSFGRGYLLRSYRLKPRRHLSRLKDASVPSLESSMTSPPELLTKLSSLLCCKDNTTKTLENIVEFGRAADLDSLDKHRDLFQKIRNCNAGSIAVWTQLSGDHNIRVFGTADSLVTKGVLAVIAEGLRALSAQAITDRFTEEVLNLPLFSQLSVLRRSGLEQLLNVCFCIDYTSFFLNLAQTIVLQIKSQVISFGVPPLHAKRPEELYVTHQGSSVAVLLSGGVDSSLALSLLKEKVG